MSRKWKLLSATKETNHPFLNFYVLHYEVDKDGKVLPYDYYLSSRHNEKSLLPLTHDFLRPDGVRILLYYFNKKENEFYLLLEKQFRPAVGSYLYSVPAGLVDKEDESVFSAAKRESREETGAVVDHLSLLIPPSPSSTGLSDETIALVKGEIVSFGKSNKEPFEDIGYSLIPRTKVKERLKKDNEYLFSFNGRLSLMYLRTLLEKQN